MLIDAHAHLNDERLINDVEEILSRFPEYGVESAVCASYDAASSEAAVELARRYRSVFATVAFHPHEAKSYTDKDGERFIELAKEPKVVAIGETGLDYFYDLSPRDVQKKVFVEHLRLADAVKLPVVIHVRDAYEDTLEILKENKGYLNHGVLIHNYSGSVEMMREFDKFGCYYSFGGTLTFKNNRRGIEAFLAADKTRILLETDCPYLTPEPHRGRLNFPYYVKFVAEKCAALLGTDVGEVAEMTKENTERLFFKLKVES
ncbi:MAG: TatD family hydrolase [Clostridiales bacterium]|jgi:TatD DNase family protein|nr:TatD family hydrolase [Clostridiales bacterium]